MKTTSALVPKAMRLPALAALMCLANLGHAADLQLQTKIYGFLNAEVESVDADGGATPVQRRGRVSDGNSRLGFSGSINIDATARGLWQLEGSLNNFDQGGVNDQGASETLTSRNSFVGIEDDRFGRVIFGNNDSAYRSLIGSGGELGGNLGMSSHGLDLWNNTSAQMTGNATSLFSRGEARYKNSVHYFSPDWAGLQAAASIGFDEALADGANHDRYSAAVKYAIGGFEIGAGFDRQRNTGADILRQQQGLGFQVNSQSGADTTYLKLVASYKLPTHTYLGLGFEQARFGFAAFDPPSSGGIYPAVQAGHMTQEGVMGSIAQDLDEKTSLLLSYGKLGGLHDAQVGSSGDYGASQISLGAQHSFNNWLACYAYYTRIQNKAQQNVNLGQSPLYSNDASTSSAYLAPGNNPRAIGFGLIARF
jgi:predicted porin